MAAVSAFGFGTIEVICGSMFSGKTEELLRRMKRAHIARIRTQVFKPILDQRYSVDHVESHDANRVISIPVKDSDEILSLIEDSTRIVGIDEAQFFDAKIVEVSQKLANRGLRVILAGLDMDYKGMPFGPMPGLLAVAEQVTKLSAVCVRCGGTASRTQRLVSEPTANTNRDQVLVGSFESYEPRCRFCHDVEPVLAHNPIGLTQFRKSAERITQSEKK